MDRRALHAATLPRSSRRLDAGTAAASLLAHGGLLLAIALLDPHSSFPILAREIPVELVSEPAAPEKRQVVAGASEKSPAQPGDTGTALQQQSGIDWESKAANKPRSSAGPGAKPAAPPASANRASGAAASHKDSAGQETAHGDGQVEMAPRGVGNRLAAGGSLALPFDSGPDRFSCRRRPFASRKRR